MNLPPRERKDARVETDTSKIPKDTLNKNGFVRGGEPKNTTIIKSKPQIIISPG